MVVENNPFAKRSKPGGKNDLPLGYTSRTFACVECGQLRRREWKGPGNRPIAFDKKQYPTPRCCGQKMKFLGQSQANAVGKLSKNQIVAWLSSGGKVKRDRRRWIAII